MVVTDDRLDTPINLKNIKLDGKVLSFDFVDRDGDNDKFSNGAHQYQFRKTPAGWPA